MKKKVKNDNTARGIPQPSQTVSEDTILSNYSTPITNFLNQIKLQETELDFVNPFQEITLDISKHIHHHPNRIPLAAISASWQRLSNEILFQVQQVNQKASDSMIQQKIASLRSAIAQIRTAAPSYQAYKKDHQALYQQIKKSISLIQQSIEVHDENRSTQQLAKFKTDLSHSYAKFFQLADMDKAEVSQILKQCKRDVSQIQRLLAGTNPLIVVPPEFYSFSKYVNSLKFEKKKAEPPRRSKTPPARFPNLLYSLPKAGFNNKNQPTNSKIKPSVSSTAISSAAGNSSSAPAPPPIKDKYVSSARKLINRSKTPPSRPISMKTIVNAQKPRTSKFSAVENYIFPKQYNSPKPGLNSSTLLNAQPANGSPFLLDKEKKSVSSIKPVAKRPVSPPNSKTNNNAKLNLTLNLTSISNTNSNPNESLQSNSARDNKSSKSGSSAKNSSRMIKKDSSKPSLSSLTRPVSPGANKTQQNKQRQSYLKTPPAQNQNQLKPKQQQPKQNPKIPKNQQVQRNQNQQIQSPNQTKKIKQQAEPSKIQPNYKRNQNISRYIDDNDIDNDNDVYNDNSNDDYNENEIDNENENNNTKQKYPPQMKRTDSLQSFDSATDQLVLAMNKAKEQVRVSSPTLEKLQRDLSIEGLFFEGDEPVEVTIGHLYESFAKKLKLFDQLIIANDKINELNQKVEQNTWKDDKELEDYLSFIDENSIIVQFLSREKEMVYDTAKSMRQMNEKIDYYLNRNNHYSSFSSSNNSNVHNLKNQNVRTNDDLTDLYATIEDQLAQITKQSPNEKERNENNKLMKKFDASKNIFYEFTEKVDAQNRIEEIKLENESIKRRISILKSIQSSDVDNDNDNDDIDNDNENKDEFDISLLSEIELNEMSLEEVLSISEYLNRNKNKIKSNYVEDSKITKNKDKFRPSEEQLKTLSSIHQQMVSLQNALVSIQNDEQKINVNDQMLTRKEIESTIMKVNTQEKNILQSIK